MKDLHDLLNSYALSTNFKTQSVFDYQSVFMTKICKRFLIAYVNDIRPPTPKDPQQPLFVHRNGGKHNTLGRAAKKWIKTTLQLNMNTTNLRTLVETTADKNYFSGLITAAQRESVCRVNGHSSKTARDYYVRQELAMHIANSQIALGLAENNDSTSTSTVVNADACTEANITANALFNAHDNFSYAEWGSEHPNFGSDAARVRFSKNEKAYMKAFAVEFRSRHGKVEGNFAAQLLAHIRADPKALPIFHENHVVDSSRIRNGLRSLKLIS